MISDFSMLSFKPTFLLSSTVFSPLGTHFPSLVPDFINNPLPPYTQRSSHCSWTFCSEFTNLQSLVPDITYDPLPPCPHRARHTLLTFFSNLSYSVPTYHEPRVPAFLSNPRPPCQHSSSHWSLTSSTILLIVVYRDPDPRLLTSSQIFQPTFAHVPARTRCLSLHTVLQHVHIPQGSSLHQVAKVLEFQLQHQSLQ